MKKLIVPIIASLALTSCGSSASMWYADKRMKDISIGMDRSEVIRIMGNYYMVNSSSKDSLDNLTEVLAYKSSGIEEYRLKFVNNKLESWNRIHLREYYPPSVQPANTPSN